MFRQKRRVRLHVKDGPTIEGIMAARTRHTYVIWAPKIITGEDVEPVVDVSGHVEVEHKQVLYYQVIG